MRQARSLWSPSPALSNRTVQRRLPRRAKGGHDVLCVRRWDGSAANRFGGSSAGPGRGSREQQFGAPS